MRYQVTVPERVARDLWDMAEGAYERAAASERDPGGGAYIKIAERQKQPGRCTVHLAEAEARELLEQVRYVDDPMSAVYEDKVLLRAYRSLRRRLEAVL